MNDFPTYITVLALVLLFSSLLYFWFVYRPYAKFPVSRLEHKIPYWILKRIPLNYAVLQTLIEQAKKYESEGVFVAWIGTIPFVFVYGEEIVKKIVNEPAATDKPRHYKLIEFATGKGILSSNGELFKKQWKMSAPAFQLTAIKTYTSIMNRHSEDMVERLSGLDGQPTDDITDIIALCSMGILGETNFGEKENDVEEYIYGIKILNRATDFLVKRFLSPWLYFDFSLRLFPSAREMCKLITDQQKDHLQPRLEKIKQSVLTRQALPRGSSSDHESNAKRLKPMGETFVEQHLQDPSITMDELTRELSFIVAAGFDTVTYSTSFALFLLGQHQEVQDRVYEEVMSETEGHITYDDLQRMTYLDCVVKETLRLYAVPIFGRLPSKDLQCGKYTIPKNSTVMVFSYMLHRNPEIYPDPEKFIPERFMDKNSRIKPFNFIPFAEGLRSCIGKNYAMVQMKIILAHVLKNFQIISLSKMEDLELTWSIVLQSTKKLRMQFLPRESLKTRSS